MLSNTVNFTFQRNTSAINPVNWPTANVIFSFAAKATAWPDDTRPPSLDNSTYLNEYQVFTEILFGKHVNASDINLMIKRNNWVTGTVYAQYDDQDTGLFDENFFVFTTEAGAYHVFKCLYNNSGANSVFQPKLAETSADAVFYATADGYQWKYMYSFDTTTFNNFVTTNYIPIVANSAVTGNSVPGGLSTYSVESGGANYNSYTNGYFTDIAVGGNSQFFGIQGPDTTILEVVFANNTPISFLRNETVTQTHSNIVATATVSTITTANSVSGNTQAVSILTLKNVSNPFVTNVSVTGATSNASANVADFSSPDVSSNTGFYAGCSLYISSGTGAGQIGSVVDYLVVGTARRVLLANSFAITPDLTSKYVISPSVVINGDGTGAQALSIIDPTTKTLTQVQTINTGTNYTYANVFVVGNTGSLSIASTNAVVRAIIPPRGGHGSSLESELNAATLGFHVKFSNTESGTIPGTGTQYRRIGLMVNPLFANVALTYSYTNQPTFPILPNTVVTGSLSGATGIVSGTNSGSNNVTLSNVSGVFLSGDLLVANYSNGVTAVNTSTNTVVTTISGQGQTFDQRTLLVCPASTLSGNLAVGTPIVQQTLGVIYASGVIQEMTLNGNNYSIFITEARGTFDNSDAGSGTTKYIYDTATQQNKIEVDSIALPDLVPFTGNILFLENIMPVIRNSLQNDNIQIVLPYF